MDGGRKAGDLTKNVETPGPSEARVWQAKAPAPPARPELVGQVGNLRRLLTRPEAPVNRPKASVDGVPSGSAQDAILPHN